MGDRFDNDASTHRRMIPPDDRAPGDPGHDDRARDPGALSDVRVPPSIDTEVVLACLQEAADCAGRVVAAHLWLADERSGTLRLIDATGPFAPSGTPLRYEDPDPIARSFRTKTTVHAAVARMRIGGEETTTWRWAMPLEAGGVDGVAAIDIHATGEPDTSRLPERTAPLRGSLTGALALYVADQRLATAHSLVDTARELSRILDPHELLETALSRAMAVSGAQTGSIMLTDAQTGRLTIAVSRGLPDEVVRQTALSEGEGIAGWVLASGQPLFVEDLAQRSPSARRHGVRSAASVPLADDDGVLGVLNVGMRSYPGGFTDAHLETIALLGKQTATAYRNARAVAESREMHFEALKALAIALETKDPYSGGGTERVLQYAEALGQVFRLPDDQQHALRIAALLHDIGMSSVGDGVRHCDRPLTTIERALLKLHPHIAAEILEEAPALRNVVPIVYHHHEWFDGHGYGDGLSGEAIPLGARILAVADAYVAMTSDRPYRTARSSSEALREVQDKAGTQFDPVVVSALADILQDGTDRVPRSMAE